LLSRDCRIAPHLPSAKNSEVFFIQAAQRENLKNVLRKQPLPSIFFSLKFDVICNNENFI